MPNDAMRKFFDAMDMQGLKLTYDDVRMRTAHSGVLPADVDLSTRFSRRINLPMPIVGSPMDTVTGPEMAIALAERGGLGMLHRMFDPPQQAKAVGRVKHRLHGRIETPITARPDQTVGEVLAMREERTFHFHSFPVVDEHNTLLGILTRNDFEFCVDPGVRVASAMTPAAELVTAAKGCSVREAHDIMLSSKRKVLPLVDGGRRLCGMYLFSDVWRICGGNTQSQSLDNESRLLVGAAVGVGTQALERAELLVRKGCDVLQVDTAHGDSFNVLETVSSLKRAYPHVDVVAGNVSRGEAAKRLADVGADGILVGQGPGAICTTRVVAGIGTPQVSAVHECVTALWEGGYDVPVCADGGIGYSGDMVIALALGASTVMLGRLLAGTEEAPGETRFYQGRQVKVFRGMGSLGAMRESASARQRYSQDTSDPAKVVPEGVESVVRHKGPVGPVLDQYLGGVRSGMGYVGAGTLGELAERAEIFRITSSGLAESHPHDITVTEEPPNYGRR